MHTFKMHEIITMILLFLSLLLSGPAFSQGAARHSAGGFLGFTDRDDADFTLGAEYEYRPREPWSFGAIVEHTPDVVFGRDFTLVLAAAHYRPPSIQRLKLTGGAGIEFKDVGGDDARFRLGAGYDVFMNGPLTITPRIAVDFGEGDESIVFGVTAMYGF
ncbi:MAG: hypothetical protein WD750_12080 [Gammaproteobacteria bacterium]